MFSGTLSRFDGLKIVFAESRRVYSSNNTTTTPGTLKHIDHIVVLMQENAIYSVISPEGCAAILWRDAGRKVEEALNILKFSPKGMAEDVYKVLASAVANAENNHNLDVDALVVAEASVGKSITMKRFHTRGRGLKVERRNRRERLHAVTIGGALPLLFR